MKRVIALILVLAMVFVLGGCSSSDYKKAQKLFENAQYEEAQAIFEKLNDYENSKDMIVECKYQMALSLYKAKEYDNASELFKEIENNREVSEYIQNCAFQQARIGDTVFFGSYEQDTDLTNGEEPIEWIVLAKEESSMLLISVYGLDTHEFGERLYTQFENDGKTLADKYSVISWSTSEVRKWLNGQFWDDAFTPLEQSRVLLREHDNGAYHDNYAMFDRPVYSTYYINKYQITDFEENPSDYVFLLSNDEAAKYFPSGTARSLLPTAMARQNSAEYENETGFCRWWLRDTRVFYMDLVDKKQDITREKNLAAYVTFDGEILVNEECNTTTFCIRPAIWVDTSVIE